MDFCDMFSGIGGISLALAPLGIRTVLYCENDKYCQQVLAKCMNCDKIDKAPIHSDINNLHLGFIKPTMIGGGFPCQDISNSGLLKGITDGKQSSLFFQIVRLIDENESINFVFLENVSNIVKCGMTEVIKELSDRDFDMYWTMKSASSVGAPHLRNRWFCLAAKRNCQIPKLNMSNFPKRVWNSENEPKRVSFKPDVKFDPSFDDKWIARCHTLGNSVLPCVVQSAFLELWGYLLEGNNSLGNGYKLELSYPYPENGIIKDNVFFSLPRSKKRNSDNFDFDVEINGHIVRKTLPTPRRFVTHASVVTKRSVHDLPTVLINSTLAIQYIKDELDLLILPLKISSLCIPNVNYIEWMMGYDADWTKI